MTEKLSLRVRNALGVGGQSLKRDEKIALVNDVVRMERDLRALIDVVEVGEVAMGGAPFWDAPFTRVRHLVKKQNA